MHDIKYFLGHLKNGFFDDDVTADFIKEAALARKDRDDITGREQLARAIVAHPNTPLPLLLDLGDHAPELLLTNPALTLHRLTNSSAFLQPQYEQTMMCMLRTENPPPWLIELGMMGTSLVKACAVVHLTPEERCELTQNPDEEWLVQKAILACTPLHPNLTPDDLSWRTVAPLMTAQDYATRRELTARPDAPAALVRPLLHDPEELVRASVAEHPQLTLDDLYEIINSDQSNSRVLCSLASRPDLTAELEQQLLSAAKEYPDVLATMLSRLSISPEIINAARASHNVEILALFALRPELSPTDAEQLACHSSLLVRQNLIKRNDLNEQTLLNLVKYSYEANILIEIAAAEGISQTVMNELLQKNEHIRAAIAMRPDFSTPEYLLNDPNPLVLQALSLSSALSQEHLATLGGHALPMIRRTVAQRLPPEGIDRLLEQDDELSELLVLNNPNLTPKHHERLQNSTYPRVRKAAQLLNH